MRLKLTELKVPYPFIWTFTGQSMCDPYLYQMPSDNSLTTNKHASYNAPKCLPVIPASNCTIGKLFEIMMNYELKNAENKT